MRPPLPAAPGPAAGAPAGHGISHRQAIARWVFALATALACAGLASAAALVPAPPGVVPLVALTCVLMPMLAAWQLPPPPWTQARRRRAAVAEFRRALDALPEVRHPRGH